MIRLEHVSKTFTSKHGSVEALKDVSLTIEKGKIFGIIGYSGAGKSTLIRCMNLLERPSAGKVWVDGEDLMTLNAKQLREKRRKMGMIFQH
ncbi:ATP-binding cassette domain-containing protein, partial [Massilicoli timonensis]